MGTRVENLFSRKLGRPVRAGEIVVVEVDASVIQDVNGPSVVDRFEEINVAVRSPHRHMITLDHYSPCPTGAAANNHTILREFAWAHGIELIEEGQGICHQRMVESGRVLPGGIVLGTDSHCCHYGVLGAFGAGISAAEEAVVLAGDKCWLRVPETIRVEFLGELPPQITGKDLALEMVRRLTQSGAIYQCLEFAGDTLEKLSVDGRSAICNMAIEAGAKGALMPFDSTLSGWLKGRGIATGFPAVEDNGAAYARVILINVQELTPLVAVPPEIDRVVPVHELNRVEVNEVVIGGCTNGRLEDFVQAAEILRSRRVNPKVRLVLAPASREIAHAMLETGVYQILLAAGANVLPPGCGPCTGLHGGLIGDGEVVLATANRNMPGRMGSREGQIYIASPVVAAHTALAGYITAGGDA